MRETDSCRARIMQVHPLIPSTSARSPLFIRREVAQATYRLLEELGRRHAHLGRRYTHRRGQRARCACSVMCEAGRRRVRSAGEGCARGAREHGARRARHAPGAAAERQRRPKLILQHRHRHRSGYAQSIGFAAEVAAGATGRPQLELHRDWRHPVGNLNKPQFRKLTSTERPGTRGHVTCGEKAS